MRFVSALLFSALTSLGSAAAVPSKETELYDAIIVGGGPAGLSALSGLARVRRNVLLIDSGEYRNQPTRHMHDVLGFDGVTPAYYRWAARKQLSHYKTVSMTNGTVTKVTPQNNFTQYTVSVTYPGNKKKTLKARKIVLATGLRDILPETPGVRENWGKGIFWCPWCDGHEHRDQPLGLLAPLNEIPGLVREMATLNRDVVAFVNGTDTPDARVATEKKSPKWEKYLRLNKVRVENRTIERIERLKNGTDGDHDPSLPSVAEFDLFDVEFTKGKPVERAAFLASFPSGQLSNVGEDMGVQLWGGRLAARQDAGLATNIPGVFAIGDANSDNVTNVPHALFSGKRSAVFLHVRLEREDAEKQLAEADDDDNDDDKKEKRDEHLEARNLWERMNGEPGDLLYAGKFDEGL